jgi:hypothetical protein
MTTVSKNNFRPLLYLVPLGAAAVGTVGIFFGAGFLLLAPPHPTTSSADPDPPAQAVEADQVPQPSQNHAGWGLSPETPTDKVEASPIPSTLPLSDAKTMGLPSNREAPPLTEIDTALIPPAGITHAKKIRVGRHGHHGTARHWVGLWRPNAHAGPLPGGGFYGPPNGNIGYINPNGAR